MVLSPDEDPIDAAPSAKPLAGFANLHPALLALRGLDVVVPGAGSGAAEEQAAPSPCVPSPGAPSPCPPSPAPRDLRRLIAANLTAEIERALADGADVNADDGAALQEAVELNKPALVRLLLRAGADVHARQDRALRYASYTGLASIVDILLTAGADVHARHEESLRWAAARGHADVVALLLAAGAKPGIALPPDSDSYPTAPEWSRGDARAMAESYKQTQIIKVLDGALRPTFQGTFDL